MGRYKQEVAREGTTNIYRSVYMFDSGCDWDSNSGDGDSQPAQEEDPNAKDVRVQPSSGSLDEG